MTFESSMLSRMSDSGVEIPIEFFISIKVETQRQWQVQTHNELMLQLAQLRILPPDMLIENMIFEGKQGILKQMADRTKGAQQGAQPASPEEAQAQAAQAQAEQAMANLPVPDELAQAASGQAQPSIVMGQ